MSFFRSRLKTALVLSGTVLAAAASAMYLYYVNNYASPYQYVYNYIGNPGQLGAPMYIYTEPVKKLQDRSRDHYILLNYLRRTYDPNYWSFSLGGDLTDWGAWVASRTPYNYGANGIQGPVHMFGFDSTFGGQSYSRNKDFIYMERLFLGNTRIEIKTAGYPFQGWNQNGYVLGRTYRETVGTPPSITQLSNYGGMGKDYLGDLFIVDHYTTDGIHHSVVIYDGFDIHVAYRAAAMASAPPRPIDPENGFLPPSGGSSGGIVYSPRTSLSQPWTSTGSDGTQTVTYTPCQSGASYPGGTSTLLPCVDATNPPTSDLPPTMGTTDSTTGFEGVSGPPPPSLMSR